MEFDEAAAELILANVRWPDSGRPVCPYCEGRKSYRLSTRRRFKCATCGRQFSVTTGTVFSDHKLSLAHCLKAMVMYEESGRKLRPRDLVTALGISPKTAQVLCKKMFEAFIHPEGPLSEPSYLMRGYWQGFNLFRLDANDVLVRSNIRGETIAA